MFTLTSALLLVAQPCYWISALFSVISAVQYLDSRGPSEFGDNVYQDHSADAILYDSTEPRYHAPSTVLWNLVSGSVPFILPIILGWTDSGLENNIQDWGNPSNLITLALGSLLILPTTVGKPECVIRHIGWAAASAFALLLAIFIELLHIQQPLSSNIVNYPRSDALWSRLALVLVIFLTLIFVRPTDLFHNGSHSSLEGSLFERFSFSGAAPILALGKARGLTLKDLPALNVSSRSGYLIKRWNALPGDGPLWRKLSRMFWRNILQFCITIFLKSLFTLAAPAFLHKLLQNLEGRTEGENTAAAGVWLYVLGFGFSLVLQAYADGWVLWVTTSKLETPLQGLLSALVFQKSVRRQSDNQTANLELTDDKSAPKSDPTISVINLLKSDSSKVAGSFDFMRHLILAFFNFVFCASYLVQLVGIRSILIGYAVTIALVPISNRLTKGFRTIQRQLPKYRDAKSNALSEAIGGLRQIRFLSLEKLWEERIGHLRSQELAQMWTSAMAFTALIVSTHISPVLLASVSLSFHAYVNGRLSPSVAFTSLGLFEQFSLVLSSSPFVRSQLYDAWISCQRLDDYLRGAEDASPVTNSKSISFENATITWPQREKSDKFALYNLNLSFLEGELSIISGPTGSGKSLILSAILGEVTLLKGAIKAPVGDCDISVHSGDWIIPGCKAYVSQPPWIESSTVRDNIIFGLPFNAARYRKVIRACALEQDFVDSLTHGDRTVVGQKGASLSGGQQWRVALARALYSRAQILVLDDVLSAVDTHVARWLLENALTGELCMDRTRILATHNAEMCRPRAKCFVELRKGTAESALCTDAKDITPSVPYSTEPDVDGNLKADLETEKETTPAINTRPSSVFGNFSWKNVVAYYRAGGGSLIWMTGACAIILEQTIALTRTWWLKKWTEDQGSFHQSQNAYFIAIYMAITLSTAAMMGSSILLFFVIGLNASKNFYQQMLHSVLKAPLVWIDSTPPGQILNRFTSDMGVIDQKIIIELSFIFEEVIHLIFIVTTCAMSSPLLLILSALLIFLYFRGLRLQLVGGRDLETIVSSTASAILDRHASTASGLETIRAFGRLPAHLDAMHTTLDASQLARQHQALAQRWINLWLRLHSALFVAAVAAAVLSRAADPSAAGFALGAAVQFSGALAQISRKLGKPDALLGAVERIAQYADMPREPALDPGPGEDGDGDEPPPDWPSSGALSVDDLSISYAPDAPPALRAVGFSLRGGERLGVVGRTGAGKSTLVAALPRFAPVSGGRVLIDGLDLSRLRLGAVRAAVALVPQDPFLFSGSLRENLAPGLGRGDADGGGGDACLLAALRRVGLVEDGSGSSVVFPSGLDTAIRDGGRNLSHGQRQLVCLARALVAQQHPDASSRRPAPRVLILDEATSAVDGAADAALQRVVRSAFAGTTLVVVAHRLSTVADFDKVLVLRDGEAVEFGAPRELAARRGLFWEMVCQSPEKEALPGILEM